MGREAPPERRQSQPSLIAELSMAMVVKEATGGTRERMKQDGERVVVTSAGGGGGRATGGWYGVEAAAEVSR